MITVGSIKSSAVHAAVLEAQPGAARTRIISTDFFNEVFAARSGKPLAATYVKVYAKREDGETFHKDGYTDLRGRFDYATLGNNATVGVTRFALFIQHPDAGSTVREVSPP